MGNSGIKIADFCVRAALQENGAVQVGYWTGHSVGILLAFVGALHCIRVARRPQSSALCLYSLFCILLALLIGQVASVLDSLFGIPSVLTGLLAGIGNGCQRPGRDRAGRRGPGPVRPSPRFHPGKEAGRLDLGPERSGDHCSGHRHRHRGGQARPGTGVAGWFAQGHPVL